MPKDEVSTALTIPEPTALAAMFRQEDGLEPIISRIESEVRSFAPDLSTDKGRKAIASLARKVSSSKVALDDAGKRLTEEARAQIKVVDAQRKTARDRLDALRDEARKPLTDWEAAEAARISDLTSRVEGLRTSHTALSDDPSADEIRQLLTRVESVVVDETWAEFAAQALQYKDQAVVTLRDMLRRAEQREAEAAELARLRAEAAERERKEAEARAAQEAAERRAAEEKAEAERKAREAAEREAAAERAVEAERARAEQAAREALERHRQELAEAKAREEQAAQAERDRIARENAAEEEARRKRQADAAHRARILGEINEAMKPIPREDIGAAIMDGRVPHVRVSL